MKKQCDIDVAPLEHEDWWKEYAKYSIFNRQGIDIVCVSFQHPNPRACVLFLTGWNDTFFMYSELFYTLFTHGYSVFTYDHQSQGMSGRWLSDTNLTWIHTFDDYVDDFVFYVTMVAREMGAVPLHLIAHSLGALIASIGMARHPSLINKVIFTSPMFRTRCASKALDFRMPLPQPLTYWLANCACWLGLGATSALGFYRDKPGQRISYKLTSDRYFYNIHISS